MEDVCTTLATIRHGLDDDRPLGLAGDSAGALIGLLAAESSDVDVDRLLLINPNADLTLSMPSIQSLGEGWGLSSRDLEWFVAQWAPTVRQRRSSALNPLTRPLRALPMTTVVTCQFDPLRDEGLALVERVRNADRLARHHHVEGMIHGIINLDAVSSTARRVGDGILSEFADDLRASRG